MSIWSAIADWIKGLRARFDKARFDKSRFE